MLKEVKSNGTVVGYIDTERGVLGHVIWYYIAADGTRCLGGGSSNEIAARMAAKTRFVKEHPNHVSRARARVI